MISVYATECSLLVQLNPLLNLALLFLVWCLATLLVLHSV